jgi:hypothetical protein
MRSAQPCTITRLRRQGGTTVSLPLAIAFTSVSLVRGPACHTLVRATARSSSSRETRPGSDQVPFLPWSHYHVGQIRRSFFPCMAASATERSLLGNKLGRRTRARSGCCCHVDLATTSITSGRPCRTCTATSPWGSWIYGGKILSHAPLTQTHKPSRRQQGQGDCVSKPARTEAQSAVVV